MGDIRLRDQEWFLRTEVVVTRIFLTVLSLIGVVVGGWCVWGGTRILAEGNSGAMGWAIVVLGAELALVALFFVVWFNARRPLTRYPADSVDAAIARAQEHDRLEAEGLVASSPNDVVDRRGPPLRRAANKLVTGSLLIIGGLLVFGLFTGGAGGPDVAWIATTAAATLVLAALPLIAISGPPD